MEKLYERTKDGNFLKIIESENLESIWWAKQLRRKGIIYLRFTQQ